MADPISVTASAAALMVGTGALAEDVIQMSRMRKMNETRDNYIVVLGVTGNGKMRFIQGVTRLNIL